MLTMICPLTFGLIVEVLSVGLLLVAGVAGEQFVYTGDAGLASSITGSGTDSAIFRDSILPDCSEWWLRHCFWFRLV